MVGASKVLEGRMATATDCVRGAGNSQQANEELDFRNCGRLKDAARMSPGRGRPEKGALVPQRAEVWKKTSGDVNYQCCCASLTYS